jgi:hypothetical protein
LASTTGCQACAKRSYAFHERGKPAKNLPNIVGNIRIEIGTIRRKAERPLDRIEQCLDVLLVWERVLQLNQDGPAAGARSPRLSHSD